jgi:hypothetical protein
MGDDDISINVAGRVFVGGYIGKTVGFVRSTSNFFDNVFTNKTSSMVNVQRYKVIAQDGGISYGALSGSYVGGVIGYVTGEVRNITLTSNDMVDGKSKIKVFNSDSSELDSNYVGTLIGRMDGRLMQGCEIAPELCDATYNNGLYSSTYDPAFGPVSSEYSPNGIIQSPTVYNYGGLVGLVNAPAGSNGNNSLIIEGKHYYPFTVDTVHNQDYAQGTSSYEYDETSDVLSASAHYINQSDIKISASLLNDLYEYRGSDMATLANNHNPVNPEAFGWAKEYTLFRNLARVHVQANETTGNSIQVIYSADYINEVYARFKEIENSSGGTGRYTPIEIAYTIYQPNNQPARLYCKYGIAEVIEGFDSDVEIDLDGGAKQVWGYEKNFEVYYSGSEWNSNAKAYYTAGADKSVFHKYGGYPGGTGRKAFWHHVSDLGEVGIDPDAENIESAIDDDVGRACDRYQFTFGYSYYTSYTYLQRSKFTLTSGFLTNSNSGVNTVNSSDPVKPVIFAFTTVFGVCDNGWVTEDEKNKYPPIDPDDTLYSKSGSIFEVTGTVYTPKVEIVNEEASKALKILGNLLAIIAAGASVAVCIFFPPAGIGLMVAITTACTAVAVGGIALMQIGIEKSLQQTGAHFNTIEDMSLGYLSSSYGRQIGWENGVMNPEFDSYLEIERTIELTKATGTPEVNQFKLKENSTVHPSMATDFMKEVQKDAFGGSDVAGDPISGNINITIPVMYFNCSNSGILPSDYEDTSIINISKDSQDATERMLSEHYGVTAISVPKYVRVDNELYCCVSDDETGGLLYANYQDVENLAKPLTYVYNYDDIIDVNGYAYILKDAAANKNYVDTAPDSHAEHLKDFYNIKQMVEKGVSHYLSTMDLGYGAKLSDDEKELLRWREAPAGEIADNNKFIYEVTFKYSGTSIPNSPHISRSVIKSEKYGDEYKSYYTETDYVVTSSEANILYFTLDGSGKEISVVLKPHIDGGNGLTLADMKINEDTIFYLVVDKENGYISKSREFVLCTKTSLIDTISNSRLDGNQISILTPIDETLLNDETVTIKFADNTSHSLKDIQDNFEAYVKEDRFIIYNGDKILISNVFAINDDKKLCYKTVDDTYAREIFSCEGQETEYFYRPRYGGEARNNNYANRYVYNYEINGKVVKFYTRFYYGDDFFDAVAKQGIEGSNDVKIESLLLPKSAYATENMSVTLAESARVSLSPVGSYIYLDYAQGNKDNMVFEQFTAGSITCYSDDLNA